MPSAEYKLLPAQSAFGAKLKTISTQTKLMINIRQRKVIVAYEYMVTRIKITRISG